MDKRKNDYVRKNENFQDSMKILFTISQFFALFPLYGASSSSCKDMFFSWFSFRTIYTLFVTSAAIIQAFWSACFLFNREESFEVYELTAIIQAVWSTCFLFNREESFEVYELNVFFFYARGALTCLVFLQLARDWPLLMKDFENVETFSLHYTASKLLDTELKIFTFIIFFSAGVEHFTVQSMNLIVSFKCETNISDTLHRFFVYTSYRQIFSYVPYNIFLGIFLQLLNFCVTFGWTFIDIFIIHASRNFAEKLVQLKNKIFLTIDKKIYSPNTWNTLRENYTHILNLFGTFNDKMNNIILLSFVTNIYFLLTQLFTWMRMRGSESTLHHIYHAFSLTLLVSRTCFVCYYGATIQEESLNIERTLVNVPSTLYNDEIKRFIMEVNASPMILTGKQYFNITRDLILKIAGSIVTYELVMIQFSGDISKPQYSHQC